MHCTVWSSGPEEVLVRAIFARLYVYLSVSAYSHVTQAFARPAFALLTRASRMCSAHPNEGAGWQHC